MTKTPEKAGTFEYRVANRDDTIGILEVLQEVAPEIPLSLDTSEQQAMTAAIIAECCDSGESWVAVDADGTVVGFVLARPDRLERFHYENEALYLPYIGVTGTWRKYGIFGRLMEKLMAKGEPLTARVLHANHCGMADRLVEIGFTIVESDAKEIRLKWG